MSHAVGSQPEHVRNAYQQLIEKGLPLTHIQQHVRRHMLELQIVLDSLNDVLLELEEQPPIRQLE